MTARPEDIKAHHRPPADRRPEPDPAPWPGPLAGTTINPRTLLATDYLNHFNEVVMLIDLVADMPDCREDLEAWRPRSYEEHFRHSNFAHRRLAMDAYAHVLPERRAALEQVVDNLNRLILAIIADPARADGETTRTLRLLIEKAGGIINGAIDPGTSRSAPEGSSLRQDDIDHLFD